MSREEKINDWFFINNSDLQIFNTLEIDMSKKTDLRIQNQDKTLNVDVRLFVPQVRQFKNSLVVFLPDVFGLENKTTNLFMEKLSETLKVDVILLDLFRGDPWNKGTPIGADYSKFPGNIKEKDF